jgi:hypothetical protein
MVLQVPYLIISNGMQHFCLHVREDGMEFLREIPRYGEIAGDR